MRGDQAVIHHGQTGGEEGVGALAHGQAQLLGRATGDGIGIGLLATAGGTEAILRVEPVRGVHAPAPLEPERPRPLGVEVVFDGEAQVARELPGPLPRDQVVVGALRDRLGDQRGSAHAGDPRDGTGPTARAMHHRGVKFHHAVGVRQPAVADAGLLRIQLGDVGAGHQGIERVLTAGDAAEGALDGVLAAAVAELEAAEVGDDDRPAAADDGRGGIGVRRGSQADRNGGGGLQEGATINGGHEGSG